MKLSAKTLIFWAVTKNFSLSLSFSLTLAMVNCAPALVRISKGQLNSADSVPYEQANKTFFIFICVINIKPYLYF